MECTRIEINLPKIRADLIWKFYIKIRSHYGTFGTFGKCRVCSENILFSKHNKDFQEHLKLHPQLWNIYLEKVALSIQPSVTQTDVFDTLKLAALVIDFDSLQEFSLRFPLSRITRDHSKIDVTEALDGFNGRIQDEYTESPVGPYMGPYDQNEELKLNLQLPDSELDFNSCTDFNHRDYVSCKVYSIKEPYKEIPHLEKIDALEIDDDQSCDEYDDDEQLVYTCTKKGCRIPCPCLPCSTGKSQCRDHDLKHIDLFDEHLDAVTIRSTDEFCTDENFFDHSYIIKYPGIPRNCPRCKKDLLHHNSYHFDLHRSCKFCRQNRFKTFAESVSEFESDSEKQDFFTECLSTL